MDLRLTAANLSDEPRGRHPSRRAGFLAVVAQLQAAHAAGMIPNVIYQDAKGSLNTAIEAAIRVVIDRHITGKRSELPEDVLTFHRHVDMSIPYLHTIKGKLRRPQAATLDHPYRHELIALMTEIVPLADLMDGLKGMVKKREVKPVEERKPGYRPPPVSTEAQRQVVALLESVTEQAHETLKTTLMVSYENKLQAFLTEQPKHLGNGKRYSAYDHFCGRERRYSDHEGYRIVCMVGTQHSDSRKPFEPLSLTERQTIFEAEATKIADEYRTFFVHKNYRKIASIIEAKNNLQHAITRGHTISLEGLEGVFVFCFVDGSHFTVVNKVVRSYSVNGKPFLRFPLTFHEVFLPGGVKMGRPSEERMNSVFVKKGQ